MYGFDHEMPVFLVFNEGIKEKQESQNGAWEGGFQLSLGIYGVFYKAQIWKKKRLS